MRLRAYAVATALLAPLPSGAATIINNSFEAIPGPLTQGEDTALDSWDYFDAIPGWTTGAGEELEIQSAGTLGYIDAHSGAYYIELDSSANSTIRQQVRLGAGRHVLTFYYAMRNAYLAERFHGSPADDTNDMLFGIEELWQSGIAGGRMSAYSYGQWTRITHDFTVMAPGTYTLAFTGTGTSDSFGALIDTVSISPVPLPGAGLLLLTALGGMARRQRR